MGFLSDIKLDFNALRFHSFCTAILIYGLFGAPTPDAIGAIEIILAILLLFAIGLPHHLMHSAMPGLLVIYGVSIPLLIGVASGHAITDIMRDLIAFGFLLLPALLYSLLESNRERLARLIIVILIAGFCFALRSLIGLVPFDIHPFIDLWIKPEPLSYLANVPGVLIVMIIGVGAFLSSSAAYKLEPAILWGIACAVCLVAASLTVQRASLFAFFIAIASILVIGVIRQPYRQIVPVLIVTIFAVWAWPIITDLSSLIFQKTIMFGANMRIQEAFLVFEMTGDNPLTLIFGHGWGARIASPAVGGMEVNYTHSLLTNMIFKSGLFGAALIIAYLYGFIKILIIHMRKEPLWVLALGLALLIHCVLYASYKSFDFGLLLVLITALGISVHSFSSMIAQDGRLLYDDKDASDHYSTMQTKMS